MLNLIFSNCHEVLTRRLMSDLTESGRIVPDPFRPESILVPGTAIRRRLELDWACERRICANVEFGFLAQWIWRQLASLVSVTDDSPFAPEKLTWRIYQKFGDHLFLSRHPRLAGYLSKARNDPLMRFELAQRVARLFDQYITYRQPWMKTWAEGGAIALDTNDFAVQADQAWQGELWRALLESMEMGSEHPAELFFRALNSGGSLRAEVLPSRVAIFCLFDIPPLYLTILAGLSRAMEVNLYLLNPCREFWSEITHPKRMAHLAAEGRLDYHEMGNPLLSGWGRQTQGLLQQLAELKEPLQIEETCYEPSDAAPPPATLLHRVQRDILDLVGEEAFRDEPPFEVGADDRSLRIHACHSLSRQLEVLHDQLLDLLATRSDLEPADVLVVMPQLEEAAPLIAAVFGTVPEQRRIPFVLTGLPRARANPVAAGLIELLKLLPSRFKASEVFALLRHPRVSARYLASEGDLDTIHEWMRESGIHWGLDANHRTRHDLPEEDSGSLDEGLDRLFLAYATAGADQPLAGHLPAGWVEGSTALALGAFDQFVADLRQAAEGAIRPAEGIAWCRQLREWLDRFFEPQSDHLEDHSEVRRAIAALEGQLMAAELAEPLSLDVILQALTEQLEASARGAAPEGCVTFAGLGPMRGLPYRVVCALGLDDTVFPAVYRPDEFDLLAAGPAQLGDRQRGRDERNLFLDLVLSARDQLILAYTGRSIRDDSELTPSILVAELSDYLEKRTGRKDRPWQISHPLQGFSRQYFEPATKAGTSRFSYVEEYARALNQAVTERTLPDDSASDFADEEGGLAESARLPGSLFCPNPLPWPETDARELNVQDLVRFFRNPCRYLLQRRLQLTLAEAEEELVDDEPFLPAWDSPGRLADVLQRPLDSQADDPESLRPLARACRVYPPGCLGDRLLEQELDQLLGFAARLRQARDARLLPPHIGTHAFDLQGESWRLNGELTDLRPGGLVGWRYDELRPIDRLTGWIRHLFLNAEAPKGVECTTQWIARTGGYRLPALDRDEARNRLQALVQLYREGLAQPLHFFPKSAWAYAETPEDQPEKALKAARRKWEVGYSGYGESSGAAYALALRGIEDPLDSEFERIAREVFRPYLEVAEEDDGKGEGNDD